jgi:hypothetical protein
MAARILLRGTHYELTVSIIINALTSKEATSTAAAVVCRLEDDPRVVSWRLRDLSGALERPGQTPRIPTPFTGDSR